MGVSKTSRGLSREEARKFLDGFIDCNWSVNKFQKAVRGWNGDRYGDFLRKGVEPYVLSVCLGSLRLSVFSRTSREQVVDGSMRFYEGAN